MHKHTGACVVSALTQECAMSRECTLHDLPIGKKARIRSLSGRTCDRSRLCALGFTPGTEVEVSSCCGGRRVRLRNSCVVLDASMAQSIMCDQDFSDSCLSMEIHTETRSGGRHE